MAGLGGHITVGLRERAVARLEAATVRLTVSIGFTEEAFGAGVGLRAGRLTL